MKRTRKRETEPLGEARLKWRIFLERRAFKTKEEEEDCTTGKDEEPVYIDDYIYERGVCA